MDILLAGLVLEFSLSMSESYERSWIGKSSQNVTNNGLEGVENTWEHYGTVEWIRVVNIVEKYN